MRAELKNLVIERLRFKGDHIEVRYSLPHIRKVLGELRLKADFTKGWGVDKKDGRVAGRYRTVIITLTADAPPKYYNPARSDRAVTRWGKIFICEDCNLEPDAPMLKHELWQSIAPKEALLCCLCTERRLGRRMTVDDLLPRSIFNAGIFLFEDRRKN